MNARIVTMALCLGSSFCFRLPLQAETKTDAATDQKPADDATELTKKLSNPVADLISVPFQNNFDFGAGPKGDGFQYKLNFQPVIPISISKDWNIISRTILPYVYQDKHHWQKQPERPERYDGKSLSVSQETGTV